MEGLLDTRDDINSWNLKCLCPANNSGAYKEQIMDAFAQVHMWWSEWIPEPINWLFSKFQNAELQ